MYTIKLLKILTEFISTVKISGLLGWSEFRHQFLVWAKYNKTESVIKYYIQAIWISRQYFNAKVWLVLYTVNEYFWWSNSLFNSSNHSFLFWNIFLLGKHIYSHCKLLLQTEEPFVFYIIVLTRLDLTSWSKMHTDLENYSFKTKRKMSNHSK